MLGTAGSIYGLSIMRVLMLGLLVTGLSLGCGEDGAAHARRVIRETHALEVRRIVRDDVARHLVGVAAAGVRIAPGFSVEEPKLRGSQMRTALRLLTKPPK